MIDEKRKNNAIPPNTEVTLQGMYTGFITSTSTELQFYVPYVGDLSNISSVSLTSDVRWTIRHADGGYIVANTTLASVFPTINVNILGSGLRFYCKATSSLSFTNNSVVSVYAQDASNKVTLT